MLDGVSLRFGEFLALDRITLDVAEAELLAIVGPSGSGKTGLLRAIAGFDTIESGAVLIGGRDVTTLPSRDRDVAMVFQEAVLFPFLRARGNVDFPLEIRDVPADERRRRVDAEGRALEIYDILDRWPRDLSAGHQQLVQVARAMVRVPSVFLLDEPLARIDMALRTKLRGELRFLQRGYGVTTVYVTNDPMEAMAIADRLAVIDGGRIQQVGRPADIYRRPVSTLVAGLVGERPMNLFEARVDTDGTGAWVVADGFRIRAWSADLADRRGEAVTVGVRGEDIEVDSAGEVAAVVETTIPFGSHVEMVASVGTTKAWIRSPSGALGPGDRTRLRFKQWHIFGSDGRVIAHVE